MNTHKSITNIHLILKLLSQLKLIEPINSYIKIKIHQAKFTLQKNEKFNFHFITFCSVEITQNNKLLFCSKFNFT